MATIDLGPFVDVRSVITLARREGGKLAGRLSRDVQALVFKRPADLAADVRQLERGLRTRADAAVKDLEARGAMMVGAVAKASTAVLGRFAASPQEEIAALTERVTVLEKRLRNLERARRKARRPSA
jgi:hypothetical protein